MTSAREAMLSPFASKRRGAPERLEVSPLADRGEMAGMGEVERAFFQAGRGGMFAIRPALAGRAEVTSPFHESWVAFACARLRSSSFSSVPALFFATDEKDAQPVAAGDPIFDLFARPTPWFSRAQSFAASSIHLDTSGEDFWFLSDDDGEPMAETEDGLIDLPSNLLAVSGDCVGDQRDERGAVSTWSYQTAATGVLSRDYPASSVVHFACYDPSDPMRGVGPMQVALRQISVAFQLERYLESVARSGGPGAWLISKKSKVAAERERMQEEIDEASHDPENASRIKLITGDFELLPNPANPKDLQSIEGLKWSRDVIASIMRVPLPCIGVLENATYRNMEEAWRQFWLAVAADCRTVEDILNSHFFPRLRDNVFARYRIRFDLSKIDALREDKRERLESAAKIASTGAPVSFNQAAREVGVELVDARDEGDEILVPSSMATFDDVITGAARPAPVATPEKPIKPSKGAPRARSLARPLDVAARKEWARSFALRILDKPERAMRRDVAAWVDEVERSTRALLRGYASGKIKLKGGRKLVRSRAAAKEKVASPADAAELRKLIELRLEVWEALLLDASESTIEGVWRSSLADAAAGIGSVSLPMTDPRVQVALAEQLVKIVEGPTSTLAAQIREALVEALGESTATGSLQERVAAILPELDDHLEPVFGTKQARALTIARTEVGHAASSAKATQYEAEGVDSIQWITSHDSEVRSSHEELDGEVRRFGDPFKPHLRYPRDPNGIAREVINCRCDYLAVVPEA